MSLREDLTAINDALNATLAECNQKAKLSPAETIADVPQLIDEAHAVGVTEGEESGYNIGYGTGYDNGILAGTAQGKQAQYNDFWNYMYHNTTSATMCEYMLSGRGWSRNNLRPNFDLKPTRAQYMFSTTTSLYGDLTAHFEECGITLDTSNCENMSNMFAYSNVSRIPTMSFEKLTTAATVFVGCAQLVTIDKIITHEAVVYNNTFMQCDKLANVVFEGVIGQNLDMHWSPLSRKSLQSIVAALSSTVTGKTLTLSPTAVNNAFTPEEWETLAATKPNWTIAK